MSKRKMVAQRVRALCASGVLWLLGLEVQAQDFTYTNTNGTITITGYTGPGGAVAIPSSISGVPVTSIGGFAFWGNGSGVTSVVIPDTVTNIQDGALSKGGGVGTFFSCTSLTNVTIGTNVAYIGFGAFADCTSLTSIIIPDSVTSIGGFAFHACTSLTSVMIGKNVSSFGVSFGYVFADCTRLTSVYFQGDAPPTDNVLNFDGADNSTIYYVPGTYGWRSLFCGRLTAPWTLPYTFIVDSGPLFGVKENQFGFGVRTNQFGFFLAYPTNLPFVVEATTNLVNPQWQPVQSVPSGGSFYFSDAQWTNYPSRLYRIRSP